MEDMVMDNNTVNETGIMMTDEMFEKMVKSNNKCYYIEGCLDGAVGAATVITGVALTGACIFLGYKLGTAIANSMTARRIRDEKKDDILEEAVEVEEERPDGV